jgi:TPR repeat protein
LSRAGEGLRLDVDRPDGADYRRAMRWLLIVLIAAACNQRRECERDRDGQECMEIAERKLIGKGIEVKFYGESVEAVFHDPSKLPLDEELVWYFEQACERGRSVGCAYAGAPSRLGDGVAIDKARAAKLLRRACDGGYRAVCPYSN